MISYSASSSLLQLTVTSLFAIRSALGGYCNWNECDGNMQGGDWCNKNRGRCEEGCRGTWCSKASATPTLRPTDVPMAVPTVRPTMRLATPSPTKAPSTGAQSIVAPRQMVGGYCNWSGCDGDVQGGEWCNFNKDRCEGGCKGKWCRNALFTPKRYDASSGANVATTTRYWDCGGGACGCAYLSSGDPSKPTHCHSNAMFEAPDRNPYGAKFYGTAAISEALGGGPWMSEGCGKCWKVTGTSPFTSTATTLVLKGANFCPPASPHCSDGKVHFDIAAPGFDVLEYSLSNTCEELYGEGMMDAFEACSGWMRDSLNPGENCDCYLFTDPVLREGCENFFSLKWNNIEVEYEEVTCPEELAQLPCWEENGNQYPVGVPDLCEDPLAP